MPELSRCPEVPALQLFQLGTLPSEEIEALAAHVEECDTCVEKLVQLQAQDALADTLAKAPPTDEEPAGRLIEALIQRLAALRPAGSTAGDQVPGAVTKELYDFLAPAQHPGDLGCLGPYRVLKVLGTGGMGVVFEAFDPQLKRSVALKTMKPAVAAGPSAGRRFLREAQATAGIEHEHIVSILHVGEERGVPFLAMPLLQGETLDARLQRERKLPTAEVLRIGLEIAEGLAAAHGREVIHRDIKPSNIWLEGEPGASAAGVPSAPADA